MRNFSVILRMDLVSSVRSRMFWIYAAVVLGTIAAIFGSGVTDSRVMGFTGLTRLLLIFIQACNLVLPVFILVSTVRTLVKERETNVFEYLLSYPITLGEYYWAKSLSRFLVIAIPLVAGLGFAAVFSLVRAQSVPWDLIALYTALLIANTFYFTGLSFLISSLVRSQEVGLGIALFLWLILIAFLDIAMLGLLIKAMVPENVIYAVALVNPVQVFKIAAISLFDPVLSVIGPAAYFILDIFGNTMLIVYALGYLLVFGLLFLLLGYRSFISRDLL